MVLGLKQDPEPSLLLPWEMFGRGLRTALHTADLFRIKLQHILPLKRKMQNRTEGLRLELGKLVKGIADTESCTAVSVTNGGKQLPSNKKVTN